MDVNYESLFGKVCCRISNSEYAVNPSKGSTASWIDGGR
jgi:hypothetical protein